jgi:hypothetical protein
VGVDISPVVVSTLHSKYIGNFIHPNEMHQFVIPLFKETKKKELRERFLSTWL